MRDKYSSNAAQTALKRLECILLYDKHDISSVFAETMKEDLAMVASEYLPVDINESEIYIEKASKSNSSGVLVLRFKLKK